MRLIYSKVRIYTFGVPRENLTDPKSLMVQPPSHRVFTDSELRRYARHLALKIRCLKEMEKQAVGNSS